MLKMLKKSNYAEIKWQTLLSTPSHKNTNYDVNTAFVTFYLRRQIIAQELIFSAKTMSIS